MSLIDPNTGEPFAKPKAGGFPPRIEIPEDAKVSHIAGPPTTPDDAHAPWHKQINDTVRKIYSELHMH